MDKPHTTRYMDSSAMKIFLSVAITFLANMVIIFAEETNVVYLPVDFKAHFGEEAKAKAHTEQIEDARNLPESRPADLDPEGHWGEVVAGFQMSIRFSTNTFVTGAPIEATVLLRNATTNSLALLVPQEASIKLVITDEHGNSLAPLTRKLLISGPSSLRLPIHRQVKYSFSLDKLFDLKSAGTYHVQAKRLIQTGPSEAASELSSGKVAIEIIPQKVSEVQKSPR